MQIAKKQFLLLTNHLYSAIGFDQVKTLHLYIWEISTIILSDPDKFSFGKL